MSHETRYLPIAVADGRDNHCRVVSQPRPTTGVDDYLIHLNSGRADGQFHSLPVQNVTYHRHNHPTEGVPLEALYAILNDQLGRELETVGVEKKLALTEAIRHLHDSLAWLVDANRVPEHTGDTDAKSD